MIRFVVALGSWLVNPLRLPACRFEPACSEYACRAFETHPAPRAIALTVGRLLRCAPWALSGYDPVPPNKNHFAPNPQVKPRKP